MELVTTAVRPWPSAELHALHIGNPKEEEMQTEFACTAAATGHQLAQPPSASSSLKSKSIAHTACMQMTVCATQSYTHHCVGDSDSEQHEAEVGSLIWAIAKHLHELGPAHAKGRAAVEGRLCLEDMWAEAQKHPFSLGSPDCKHTSLDAANQESSVHH
eukprot:1146809-Pelagomonas_calceolata.AAC.3